MQSYHAVWSLASCYYVRLLFFTSLDCSICVTWKNKLSACSSWIWSISSRNNILFTNVMRPFINVDGTRYCFILQILILKGMLLTIGLWSRSCRNILQGQRILIFSGTRTYELFHACLYFWKNEHSSFVGLFLFDILHMWKGGNLIKREKRGEIMRGEGGVVQYLILHSVS